jgi:hypothetical protein
VYALFVSTHYRSNVTADEGGPVYYQQQILSTVQGLPLSLGSDAVTRPRSFLPRRAALAWPPSAACASNREWSNGSALKHITSTGGTGCPPAIRLGDLGVRNLNLEDPDFSDPSDARPRSDGDQPSPITADVVGGHARPPARSPCRASTVI